MVFKVLTFIVLLTLLMPMSNSAQDLPELPGKIAYIGPDHNVYVYDGSAGQTDQLTVDADQSRRYQWPSWSTDGRLAYFCCDLQFSQEIALEVFISANASTPGKLIYEAENEGFTYAYWSPANCSASDTCRDLSVLVSQISDPFKIELIRDDVTPSSTSLGEGAPFYHSWSADGNQMIWQRNTSLLSIYDVATGEVENLPFVNGSAQVPLWSPISNELLLAIINEEDFTTDLVVVSNEDVREIQKGLQGTLWLSWSPDGQYVAYSTVREGQGALVVLNASTGEFVQVLSPMQVISYFWSPDSQSIAYLTPLQGSSQGASTGLQTGEFQLVWSVLNLETGGIQTYDGFTPTPEMIYLISFFDQFAPSHAIWSPDSRYLLYSEVVNGVENRITILDTMADDPVTYILAEGVLGIWSFE